jgi:hypothetical protein
MAAVSRGVMTQSGSENGLANGLRRCGGATGHNAADTNAAMAKRDYMIMAASVACVLTTLFIALSRQAKQSDDVARQLIAKTQKKLNERELRHTCSTTTRLPLCR